MSKGSRQRPGDAKKFGDNYDKIFGKGKASVLAVRKERRSASDTPVSVCVQQLPEEDK